MKLVEFRYNPRVSWLVGIEGKGGEACLCVPLVPFDALPGRAPGDPQGPTDLTKISHVRVPATTIIPALCLLPGKAEFFYFPWVWQRDTLDNVSVAELVTRSPISREQAVHWLNLVTTALLVKAEKAEDLQVPSLDAIESTMSGFAAYQEQPVWVEREMLILVASRSGHRAAEA
jgi:hypothetical protein